MQTSLSDFIRHSDEGDKADEILRKCVHCGFCLATCPTYQLLGDERDSPRGRIYLIKQMLEGADVSQMTQTHLDRCLTCRACETTCPSGVEFGHLIDIGRAVVAERAPPRPLNERAKRWVLRNVLPDKHLFGLGMKLGSIAKPLLPKSLQSKLPRDVVKTAWPSPRHPRRMLVLAGCVQPSMMPETNLAAARVLDAFGISLLEHPKHGCCGAMRFHLDDQPGGLDNARRLIDQWWSVIETEQVEAIVMTASGCGAFVRDYANLLSSDKDYAVKAARIVLLTRDLAEVVAAELGKGTQPFAFHAESGNKPFKLAFQAPCTLQHGQKITGTVESILMRAGFEFTAVPDGHLCCGSAGTYALLQSKIATALRDNKLAALHSGQPQGIASANIGCISHLQSGSDLPIRHWIEWLNDRLVCRP